MLASSRPVAHLARRTLCAHTQRGGRAQLLHPVIAQGVGWASCSNPHAGIVWGYAGLVNPHGVRLFSALRADEIDYYRVLGVARKSSMEKIKKRYRALAKEHHPDIKKSKGMVEAEEGDDKFALINEAYAILGDEDKRRAYDLENARHVAELRARNEGNAWSQEGDDLFRKSRFDAATRLRADTNIRGQMNRKHRTKVHIPTKKQTYWRMAYPVGILALWGFNYWYFHYTF